MRIGVFKRPPAAAVSRHFVLLAGNDEDDPAGAVSGGGGRCKAVQVGGKTREAAGEGTGSRTGGLLIFDLI